MSNQDKMNHMCYKSGCFCGKLQRLAELAIPDYHKKGAQWAEDLLLLLEFNPESTIHLLEGVLDQCPPVVDSSSGANLTEELTSLSREVLPYLETKETMEKDLFRQGFADELGEMPEEVPVNLPPQVEIKVEETPPPQVAEKVETPFSVLLGVLSAKVQFMDEFNQRFSHPKGLGFIEDVYLFSNNNYDGCCQIIHSIIERLPQSVTFNGVQLTLSDIHHMEAQLSRQRFEGDGLDRQLLRESYHNQVTKMGINEEYWTQHWTLSIVRE